MHQCTVCKKMWISESRLNRHSVVHTGEKPFLCPHEGCGERLSQAGGRDRHYEAMHCQDRRFKCEYLGCDSAFSRNDNLQQHIRTHIRDRHYPCRDPHCDMTFVQPGHVTRQYRRRHSKEGRLRQKLEEEKVARCLRHAGIPFAREHVVTFQCWGGSKASADFLVLNRGMVVIVEVDEFQHSQYGQHCEVARMAKIHESLALEGNTLPVVIIRYNPHAFKVDGETKRTTSRTRQTALVDMIRSVLPGPDSTLSIVYMYYDAVTTGGEPTLSIWDLPVYSPAIRSCCRPPTI